MTKSASLRWASGVHVFANEAKTEYNVLPQARLSFPLQFGSFSHRCSESANASFNFCRRTQKARPAGK